MRLVADAFAVELVSTAKLRNRKYLRKNREVQYKNREFEPGIVQIDFRIMFSEGTAVLI